VKITVDRTRCASNGFCESIAPAFFEIGDDGVLVQLRETSTSVDEEAKLIETVRSCPAVALSIGDD
jgi:ferredoxin